MVEPPPQPGASWLHIVTQPTLGEFSRAFSANPSLEATVLAKPLLGATAIYGFFCATRAMYERIAFVHEIRSGDRTCLEWEGVYRDQEVSGATILAYDLSGVIERIRLFHYPYEQLFAFSTELERRGAMTSIPINNFSGVHAS